MSFAEILKHRREEAGLTQKQLAELAGLNQFGIAKLEIGSREPTWATVQALAAALDLDCTAFAVSPTGPSSPERPRKAPAAPSPASPAAETADASVEAPRASGVAKRRRGKGKK